MIMMKRKWRMENDWHELAWSPLAICGFKWWPDRTLSVLRSQIFGGV